MKNDEVLSDPSKGGTAAIPRQVPLRTGWVVAVIGLLLMLGVGILTAMTHQDGQLMVVYGFLFLFGLNALVGGIRMIRTRRRSMLTTVLAFGLMALIVGAARSYISDDGSSTRSDDSGKANLVKMADKLSQNLPKMVDPETRWDSVTAGPGEKLTYNYTLVNYASGDLDRGAVSTFLANAKKQACGLRGMKDALQSGSAVEFKWRSKDGRPVTELRLTAEVCR